MTFVGSVSYTASRSLSCIVGCQRSLFCCKNLINYRHYQSVFTKTAYHNKIFSAICSARLLSSISKMGFEHEVPLESPILYLKCDEAFKGLSTKERMYAHHLSRASWWGSFIILCQTSPESPLAFCMFTRLFRSQSLDSLRETAMTKCGFNSEEFQSLLVYYSSMVYNMGNFLGFGDKKFVPSIGKQKLEGLIRASQAFIEASPLMEEYLHKVLDSLYNLGEKCKFLGMPPNITMYFTPNCTGDDAELVKRYMAARGMEAWNSRLLKYPSSGEDGELLLDIRLSSADLGPAEGITVEHDQFEGRNFCVSRGDYAFFMRKMTEHLQKARDYTANAAEVKMLDHYIDSFLTGSLKAHKDGSACWVKNRSPAVETYIGFVEVYRDPTNQRAEFESFVAMVNREQSLKFDTLVSRAENEFLPLLPWGKDFEEDTFMRPDYSCLDVLTFCTSGLPIGINIPNYKEVKEEEGFKNVSLSNVIASRNSIKGASFLSQDDLALRESHGELSMDIQVGLHELLGHGSGKCLRRKDDGTLNFEPTKLKNPLTGGDVTFYEKGENYNSRFSSISSAYEECRAETVALYLNDVDAILDVFSVPKESRDDLIYVGWLKMLYSGLIGLEMYQPSQGKWGQAHCQARYVILRVALEAGQGLVTIKEVVGKNNLPDLLFSIDRSKLMTVGRPAIGEFLKKLQIYRSTGDAVAGCAMFEKYSEVPMDGDHPFGKWHEIVLRERRPRMLLTMPNTAVVGEKDHCDVSLKSYPDGAEGMVTSWVDRFSASEYDEIERALLQFTDSWGKQGSI